MGKTFNTFDCFVYIVYIVVVILHISFIVFLLLILSGDVELNPGLVNSRNRQCRVLYSNIRGLYGNLHDLIVAFKGCDILFCSKTLVSNFKHTAELSIPGFKRPILFKRNEINRAQGMAVYIRNGCSASHKATFECGCHEVQIIKVCGKHKKFYLFSVYRNPDADDGIFYCLLVSMAAIQENDRKASFVFIGNFNAHHKEWLNSISQTDCHGLRALDFSSESGCDQIIHSPTHRSGNCLDLIFTDTPGVVAGNVGSPVGTSDHCYVSAIIKTEHAVPDISFSRKIYLKSQADWNGILNDLRELDWPDIYRQVDFVASMNDGFERIVRRIPSRVIKFCIKDKAWFNEDCKRANLAKQEAYQLWRRNRSDITWNNSINLRNAAHETYAAAEKKYNDGIRDTLVGTTILINGGLH